MVQYIYWRLELKPKNKESRESPLKVSIVLCATIVRGRVYESTNTCSNRLKQDFNWQP